MKRQGRMLVLLFCLLALPAGGVGVVAQEKQTGAQSKPVVEAEQLKSKRAVEAEQAKATRAAETERVKAKRAVEAEQAKATRAVEAEQRKAKRAVEAEQAKAKRNEMLLDGTFKLLGSKLNAHTKMVKGAPYSATAVTESKQALSDGNQIIQRDEVAYYRDSEGRTRIEQTLKKIGKWVAAGDPKRIIMIADPVAGHSYYLDPSEHKATKAPLFHKVVDPAAQAREADQRQKLAWEKQRQVFEKQSAKQRQLFEEQWNKREQVFEEQRAKSGQASQEQWAKQKQMFEEQRVKQKQEFDERWEKQKQNFEEQWEKQKQNFEEQKKRQGFEGSMWKPSPEKSMTKPPAPSSPDEKPTVAAPESVRGRKTETLGKRVVEGVEAEGRRTTLTIPAGEIGNTLPIYIVDEGWYSPDLQMQVMTRHHDPRSGETVFRLTNISRSEPARSLFEVPAGYTIVEKPPAKFGPSAPPKIGTTRANPDKPNPLPKPPPKGLEPVKTTLPQSQ